jgi:hypothetical protein
MYPRVNGNAVMRNVLGLISAALVLAGCQSPPVQLALLNPVQIFPESTSIRGARLNLLYGANENLYGVDAGLINPVTDEVGGIQLGAYHSAIY